jgi:preprotein translocase subunit SecY
MQHLFELVQKVRRSRELSRKFLFLIAVFAICRLLAFIPVPMIDVVSLKSIFENSQLLSIFNIFSGGTLANFSIAALGVSPYISASIIMQLAGVVFPKIKEAQKDGERGRQKVNQWTRLLSLPLAIFQSVSIISLLRSNYLLLDDSILVLIAVSLILTAGAFLMTWLGELITQYGLGNGVSMIMTVGIVSQIPTTITRLMSSSGPNQNWFGIIMMIAVMAGVIAVAIVFNEAVRQVHLQYAKRIRGNQVTGGQSTFLPIKVNATGVMPIIFGLTLLAFPPFLGQLFISSNIGNLVSFGNWLITFFNQNAASYMITYFVLVFVFTYFSNLIFFNTEDLAEELKKSGAFVPGIRPGEKTKNFLKAVTTRLTLINAVYMSAMALIPYLLQSLTKVNSLAIGGTSILILVSVILETTKQIDGATVEQNYDKYK